MDTFSDLPYVNYADKSAFWHLLRWLWPQLIRVRIPTTYSSSYSQLYPVKMGKELLEIMLHYANESVDGSMNATEKMACRSLPRWQLQTSIDVGVVKTLFLLSIA